MCEQHDKTPKSNQGVADSSGSLEKGRGKAAGNRAKDGALQRNPKMLVQGRSPGKVGDPRQPQHLTWLPPCCSISLCRGSQLLVLSVGVGQPPST